MKHAFLIMAHNEPELLCKLIKCLDHERNHIFLHLDKRFDYLSEKELSNIAKKSKIFFVERKEVHWSGYSQIDCELRMLKDAIPYKYGYYHFISGVDLPIKTQDYIHDFFEEHSGIEFVSAEKVETWKVASRYKYYHFIGLNKRMSRAWSRSLRFVFSALQAVLFIDRTRKMPFKDFFWGGAWFSITHDFAKYIIDEEPNIYNHYKHGFFNDEVFLATYLMNSKFKEKHSSYQDVRCIDWTRGNPYIWTNKEFEEIMASEAIFARKFSMNKDKEVIERIINQIS